MKKLTMKLKAFGVVSKEKKFVGYENDKYVVLTVGRKYFKQI